MKKNTKLRYVVIGVILLSVLPMKALISKNWIMLVVSIGALFLFVQLTDKLGHIQHIYRLAIQILISGLILGVLYHLLPSMQVLLAFSWLIWMIFFPLRLTYKIQKNLPLD